MDTIEKMYVVTQMQKTQSLSFWEIAQEGLHAREEREVSEKEVVGIQILPQQLKNSQLRWQMFH